MCSVDLKKVVEIWYIPNLGHIHIRPPFVFVYVSGAMIYMKTGYETVCCLLLYFDPFDLRPFAVDLFLALKLVSADTHIISF